MARKELSDKDKKLGTLILNCCGVFMIGAGSLFLMKPEILMQLPGAYPGEIKISAYILIALGVIDLIIARAFFSTRKAK